MSLERPLPESDLAADPIDGRYRASSLSAGRRPGMAEFFGMLRSLLPFGLADFGRRAKPVEGKAERREPFLLR